MPGRGAASAKAVLAQRVGTDPMPNIASAGASAGWGESTKVNKPASAAEAPLKARDSEYGIDG